MTIDSIKIKNFKGFIEKEISLKKPDGNLGSGLSIFVGENNSGKSTLFEAIDFLRNGVPKNKTLEDLRNISVGNEETFVEIVFSGNIKELVDNFAAKDFSNYILTELDSQKLIARRSSKTSTIKQGKKEVDITPNKIGIWNFFTNQFENPSGIDADFKKFFEIEFIWSDTNPEDITKFGSATICGKLLADIVNGFKKEKEYIDFQTAHNQAFNDPSSGLKQKLKDLEIETENIFKDQFGFADIEFSFDELEIESFFRNTRIKINDGTVKTDLEDKGGGMQRSVALALLQVYAEKIVKHPEIEKLSKPFYLFIDEPEICLHPQAQNKLLESLKNISKTKQVFVATHSIYFVEPQLIHNIYKFENNISNGGINIFYDKNGEIDRIKKDRTFFLHHRSLFFTNQAIFVEGVTDLERLSLFLIKNNLGRMSKNLYLLNGKGDYESLKKICDVFKIKNYLVADVDYIDKDFVSEYNLTVFPDKDWHRGKRSEKKYQDLFSNKQKELKSKNILILSRPDIIDFLDENGEAYQGNNEESIITIGTKKEKEDELRAIFSGI
jgi:predicted ATP-dependent endonuclease of OLD family